MDWKRYWDKVGTENSDLIAQVQRNSESEIGITADHILNILAINKLDSVLDVCCGNGLLTSKIALHCKEIVGIDQSIPLINTATTTFSPIANLKFVAGAAPEIPKLLTTTFDKIYLEYSFQYFINKNEGQDIIRAMLSVLKPNGTLFIGDIPEKGKEKKLYNTITKKLYWQAAKIKGKNSMGKFWSSQELFAICEKLGVKGEKKIQPSGLPYSHYRFDYLITK